MQQSMVRVLHPNYQPYPHGLRGERVYPTLSDYIEVPRLNTYGAWRIKDVLPPETVLALAKLANRLENKSKNRPRVAFRA